MKENSGIASKVLKSTLTFLIPPSSFLNLESFEKISIQMQCCTTGKELMDIKLDYSLNVELERSILSYSGTLKVGTAFIDYCFKFVKHLCTVN